MEQNNRNGNGRRPSVGRPAGAHPARNLQAARRPDQPQAGKSQRMKNPQTVRSDPDPRQTGRERRTVQHGRSVAVRNTSAVEKSGNFLTRASELLDRRREWITERNEKRIEKEKMRNAGIVRVRAGVDRPMLVLILVLLALGTIAVFSASYPSAISEGRDPLFYIKRQAIYALVGVGLMMVASAIPYTLYRKLAPALFGASMLLLLAVIFIGKTHMGAKRWLAIPGVGFEFQPSETMKIAIVLILAWYLDKYRERVTNRLSFKDTFLYGVILPAMITAMPCALVLAEKHLSGAAIIGFIGITVMLIGGSHIGITLGGAGAVGLATFFIYLAKNEYAAKRFDTKLDANADVLAEKWQTTQGLLAIGSGGLLGVGLGSGRLKYSYVSEAQNDFIFTIWCEETGFVGAILVVVLFLAFIWRGYKIAMHAPDTFSALTVFGLTSHVGLQAFLNILVVTDVIFNTGVSLPFFSYGGSSLLMLMGEMGIILSVSKHSFQKR